MKLISGFWAQLEKPIIALAPMHDVTDPSYRKIIALTAKADISFTEFVSCDGLCSVGSERLKRDLNLCEEEKPVVAQIWGAKPETFYKSAKMISLMGFDGIDINMGCPEKNIQKQGACASLINNHALADEIIRATKEGAGDTPVSVKTRIGYNEIEIDKWIPVLANAMPAAISIHGRTKKVMYAGLANYEAINQASKIIKDINKDIIVLGNGDIKSMDEAKTACEKYEIDGVMIGRAAIGNPWVFSVNSDISIKEKLNKLLEHANLFESMIGDIRNFNLIKKHVKGYCSGFSGAKELRIKLMTCSCASELKLVINEFLNV